MTKVGVSSVVELVKATSVSSTDVDSPLDIISRLYPGLISYWDRGLVARFANSLHETFIGRSVDDILGRSMDEVLGASSFQQSAPFIRGVLNGAVQHFMQVMHLPGGGSASVCTVYSPQFDKLGEVQGFIAFMIEASMLQDGAVRVARRKPAGLGAAAWAEMVLDEDSRIVSVNDEFTNITLFRSSEVRGQTPIMIRPLGVEPSAFMKVWGEMRAQSHWQGMVWYRRRDGYLFRSRQQVIAERGRRGPPMSRVRFSEIKIP